jgi:hypothetical protein
VLGARELHGESFSKSCGWSVLRRIHRVGGDSKYSTVTCSNAHAEFQAPASLAKVGSDVGGENHARQQNRERGDEPQDAPHRKSPLKMNEL